MKTLSEENRKKLKNTVIEARRIAEDAADEVIESLGIREKDKPSHLDQEKSELRRNLRAKARQLGDERQGNGYHETVHLEREIAYEHWHRMLFAEFLAENDLLIHPEMEVPVSIEECNQLAEEREEMDGFELSAQFASDMLPEIFKKYDPVLNIKLAPEYRKELKDLIANLPKEVFKADDSLGWVYQFWQEKKKDEINESEVDIGADELPPVTQLFTEHYMVKFLLDNTLGAWWKLRHPNEDLPIDFEYLRTTEDSKLAAGEFEGWPDKAAEIEVLDPAMGSGHFLITALPMLVQMRIKEEGLSAEKAVDAVLRDNIYGLEIDERCTQIAAFALAFSAWNFPETGGYRELPELNLACSGIAPEGNKNEWLELAEGNDRLKRGLEQLYDQFQNAPSLGSLLDPSKDVGDLVEASFEKLKPLVENVLKREDKNYHSTNKAVLARGIAKAAQLLSKKYHLLVTNPPFLGVNKFNNQIRSFVEEHYTLTKRELALSIFQRSQELLFKEGVTAFVLPGEWTFVRSYRDYRDKFIKNNNVHQLIRLGDNSFRAGIRADPLLIINSVSLDNFSIVTNVIDVSETPLKEKPKALKENKFETFEQDEWTKNEDSRMIIPRDSSYSKIGSLADARNGMSAGDSKRFHAFFWEVSELKNTWDYLQSSPNKTQFFDGRSKIVKWEEGSGEMADLAERVKHLNHSAQNWRRGEPFWGKDGIVVSKIGANVSFYTGEKYDSSCLVVVPKESSNVLPLYLYAKQGALKRELSRIHPTWQLSSPKTLLQLPFNLDKWKKKTEGEFPTGFPNIVSNDPTQWIFEGNVKNSERPLQVAVARLLGYSWPGQQEKDPLEKYEDKDGIVCLPAVKGERKAVDRLRDVLAEAYGTEWSNDKETELLEEVDYGKYNLERWLWFKFAKQHYKLFNNRPFIWHITDGKKGGFSALVNYHKLDKKNLENLTYSYLGDWITKQERRYQNDKEGAEGLLQAAEELKEKLEAIIKGEPPYNIFVRWKTIAEQPIHWNPDLNDGVRMNIRPFYRAGILRHSSSLSINWNKDRGKDPESSYWYQRFKRSDLSEDKYNGERYNRYKDFPFTEGKLTNKKIRNARRDSKERDYEEYIK